MRTLIIIFLLTISTCIGQTSVDKLQKKIIDKWELKQFEDVEKNGNIVTVTLTKYAESVLFEFKDDKTLEVSYSDSKKEKYLWDFKRKLIEIIAFDGENFNPEIVGIFEIHFLDNISQLFLQRKNNPHHGIMLKM